MGRLEAVEGMGYLVESEKRSQEHRSPRSLWTRQFMWSKQEGLNTYAAANLLELLDAPAD